MAEIPPYSLREKSRELRCRSDAICWRLRRACLRSREIMERVKKPWPDVPSQGKAD